MSNKSITEGSAEKEQELKRPIDMQFRVRYQYVENQHSGEHLQGLVEFLAESTFHDKPADGSEGEE